MLKTLYTLNIGNYEPIICDLTYPLLKHYANKIGAQFHVITERKFPEWPITYEKLQIHELAKQRKDDWAFFLDSDTLCSPEMFDVTNHLPMDTIAHNGRDMAGVRWKYDEYFLRDGRHHGSCNWCSIASKWCLDLWRPLDDISLQEALSRIYITIGEHNSGHCKTEHLIDDYALSRNVARFGLKATTITDICGTLGWKNPAGQGASPFLFHLYTLSAEDKLKRMLMVVSVQNSRAFFEDGKGGFQLEPIGQGQPPAGVGWGIMDPQQWGGFKEKHSLNMPWLDAMMAARR